MTLVRPATVLTEDDIEHPMQVFDLTVTAYRFGIGFGRNESSTAHIEGLLTGEFSADVSFSLNHLDPGEFRPMLMNGGPARTVPG
jgi:hypothetical protein